jgi:hypothetical protein
MNFFHLHFFSIFFHSPLLIGDVKYGDVVKEVREPSYIETHEKVVPLTSTFQSTLL